MAFLERKSVVSYRCSCGRLKPLCRTYFCRHCFQLRCEFCVFHEIDSRHCPTCLESLTVADAWMKANKCSNCLQCPMCQSNLTTRIFHGKGKVDVEGDAKTSAPVKSYYLACLFCRWSTRDIGMSDASTSANKWPELENPNAEVINTLVEYYKAMSLNDRMIRERKTPGTRRPYTHISGLSVAMVRQKAGLTGSPGLPYRSAESFQDSFKQMKVTKGVASEPKNDLPDDIYTTAPDLTKVTTLKQRHRLPEAGPEDTQAVRYIRKNLMGKRSLRCRTCEHNVIKPEFLPTNTKFKIQLSAYYLVPEVRIKTVEPLRAGKTSELLILIVNPTQHPTEVTLLPYDDHSSDSKAEMVTVPVRELPSPINVTADFPNTAISLPGRDDVAEFDDTVETPNYNDDPNVVAWRKANKVVLKLAVKPDPELAVGSPTLLGVTLSHVYTNTVILQEKKQLNRIDHAFKLVLDLGKIVGSQK